MHILVIGGNGRTGRLVIAEALQRGHTITALIRNPSASANILPAAHVNLTIIQGTPLSPTDISLAFTTTPDSPSPPTAIIVTLSSSPQSKDNHNHNDNQVMSTAHSHLLTAMKKHHITKIASLSSFGVGSSFPNINFLMRWAISHTGLAHSFADMNRVEDTLKSETLKSENGNGNENGNWGLEFVLFKPARLTDGPKAKVKFAGDEGRGMGLFAGLGGISRASVAGCLVDAVERGTWDRCTPVISN